MEQYQKIYLNRGQMYLRDTRPHSKTVLASRRFGKATCVALDMRTFVDTMPRCRIAISVATFKQALTNTLPAAKEGLERLGYIQGIHYFVGRKAPVSSNFAMPYFMPDDWYHCIHFYNGTVFTLLSDDVKFSANSATFDGLIVDEAKTVNRQKMLDETIPAISGHHAFKDIPWHCGKHIYSDMPTSRVGLWLLDEEKKMNKDIILMIESILYELYELNQKNTNTPYYEKRIQQKMDELNFWRSKAYLFVVYNILDNIHVVGEKYIRDQHRDLPPALFRTALLSERLKKALGGFYASLNSKHYYFLNDNSFLNNIRDKSGEIDLSKFKNINCLADADYNSELPLYIAMDVNNNINWLIVGQPDYDNNVMYTLKSFWVKNSDNSLFEVCKQFADYYRPVMNRDVVFYFDHTFKQGKNPLQMAEAYYQYITKTIQSFGYDVNEVYIGSALKHKDKHLIINQGLTQSFENSQTYLFPKFNYSNNETLLTAMEQTGTTINRDGWGKDKSGEKEPDTVNNPVEYRPDGTDAWDTLYIGLNLFPFTSTDFSSNNY